MVLWCEAHWGPGACSSAVVGDTGLKVQEHGMEGREEEEFQGDVAISDRWLSIHSSEDPSLNTISNEQRSERSLPG